MISSGTVTVLDDYDDSTSFGPFPTATQITLKLDSLDANGNQQGFSGVVRLLKGKQGVVDELPEIVSGSPGWFSYNVHCLGFKIRNAVAGSAVTYEAQAWFPDDPYVATQVGGLSPFEVSVFKEEYQGSTVVPTAFPHQAQIVWEGNLIAGGGITDPSWPSGSTDPVALRGGLFVVNVTVNTPSQAGVDAQLGLTMDGDGDSPEMIVDWDLSEPGVAPQRPNRAVSGAYFVAAGDSITGLNIRHNAPGNTTYSWQATIAFVPGALRGS